MLRRHLRLLMSSNNGSNGFGNGKSDQHWSQGSSTTNGSAAAWGNTSSHSQASWNSEGLGSAYQGGNHGGGYYPPQNSYSQQQQHGGQYDYQQQGNYNYQHQQYTDFQEYSSPQGGVGNGYYPPSQQQQDHHNVNSTLHTSSVDFREEGEGAGVDDYHHDDYMIDEGPHDVGGDWNDDAIMMDEPFHGEDILMDDDIHHPGGGDEPAGDGTTKASTTSSSSAYQAFDMDPLGDDFAALDALDGSSIQIHPTIEPTPEQATILKKPYRIVDSEEDLQKVVHRIQGMSENDRRVALDIEAFCTPGSDQRHLGQISLVQFCTLEDPEVQIVDVLKIGASRVQQIVGPMLSDGTIQKFIFDCRRDVEALSIQMNIKPKNVCDLQLFHTAVQWKAKGASRRSGLSFVLKSVLGVDRTENDAAVQAAMTLGNRAVWDVRPLAENFLEYAADDVRHVLILADALLSRHPKRVDGVERLTAVYIDHYSVGKPVLKEADPAAHQVLSDWLERFLGPAGVCAFCGVRGHVEQECFKKHSGVAKCAHCGEIGHLAPNCYRKSPQLLKCDHCGQIGHTEAKCYVKQGKDLPHTGERSIGAQPSQHYTVETGSKKMDDSFDKEEARLRSEGKDPVAIEITDPIVLALQKLKEEEAVAKFE